MLLSAAVIQVGGQNNNFKDAFKRSTRGQYKFQLRTPSAIIVTGNYNAVKEH